MADLSMAVVLKGEAEAKAGLAGINAKLDELKGSTGKASMSMADLAGGFYMAERAARTLATGVMAIVDAAKQYDSVRARLTATEGSSLVAADDLKRLQELAKLPGLGFGEAANAMAALRSLHVSAKDTFALIEGIAKGNASMGGGAEAFGRVMYQIQQSIGKSKVSMEDLRPVMEAIPNIGSMIAEKFGSIDSDAINKKLESMGKTSKDFWMDIAEMASKLPPAGDTIANNIDNIGDAWTRLKASLANTDVIKAATGALARFIDAVAQRKERADESRGDQAEALALARKRSDEARAALGPNASISQRMAVGFGAYYEAHEAELLSEVRFNRAKATLNKQYENDEKDAEAEKKRIREKARADQEAHDKKAGDSLAKQIHDKKAGDSLAKQIHDNEAKATQYVTKTGKNEVTLKDGAWGDDPTVAEHIRNRERAEAARKARELKQVQDRKDMAKRLKEVNEQIASGDESLALKKVRIAKMVSDAETRAAAERIEAQREIAQQGEKTFATLAGVAENSAGRQSAAYKALFTVSKGFAIADASIQIADALAKSANMPFPMNIGAMATTAALTAGIIADIQAVTMAGHAAGGTQFGGAAWRHESGPEMAHAIVPTQILQASHTTNTTHAPVTIHIHGGDQKAITRTIRNAITNGQRTSH